MSMEAPHTGQSSGTGQSKWRTLLMVGAIAPIVTIVLYVAELSLIRWEQYPETIEEWFRLFNESAPKALFYLNSLDMIAIGVLGVMFLALHVSLRETSPSLTIVATPFAFLGVGVFLVPRTALLSLGGLSRAFEAAATAGDVGAAGEGGAASAGAAPMAAEQAQLLAAGRAVSALGVPTLHTAGFFIVALAAVLVSIAMLRSAAFPRAVGIIGTGAFILTLVDVGALMIAPAVADTLLVVAGIAWVAWWVAVSWSLFRLAGRREQPST